MALSDAETGMIEPEKDPHIRRDLRQLETAVKKWNVPETLIKKSLEKIEAVLDDPETSQREQILAVKCVGKMIEVDNMAGKEQQGGPVESGIRIYIPSNNREVSLQVGDGDAIQAPGPDLDNRAGEATGPVG